MKLAKILIIIGVSLFVPAISTYLLAIEGLPRSVCKNVETLTWLFRCLPRSIAHYEVIIWICVYIGGISLAVGLIIWMAKKIYSFQKLIIVGRNIKIRFLIYGISLLLVFDLIMTLSGIHYIPIISRETCTGTFLSDDVVLCVYSKKIPFYSPKFWTESGKFVFPLPTSWSLDKTTFWSFLKLDFSK